MAGKKQTGKKRPRKVKQLEINDLETLKVLTHPTRLAIIESIANPCSVTEIGTRLYHHIKLLEEHGLIRVTSTRSKGALSEKMYEPTADSYLPGPKLLKSTNRADRAEAMIAGVLDTTREDLRRSLLAAWSEEQPGESKQVHLTRSLFRLMPEEAEQFSNDLTALIERYGDLHEKGEQPEDARMHALTLLFYPSSRHR